MMRFPLTVLPVTHLTGHQPWAQRLHRTQRSQTALPVAMVHFLGEEDCPPRLKHQSIPWTAPRPGPLAWLTQASEALGDGGLATAVTQPCRSAVLLLGNITEPASLMYIQPVEKLTQLSDITIFFFVAFPLKCWRGFQQ